MCIDTEDYLMLVGVYTMLYPPKKKKNSPWPTVVGQDTKKGRHALLHVQCVIQLILNWLADWFPQVPRGTIQIAGIQVGCLYDTGAETSVIPSSIFHTQLKEKLGEDAMKKMDGLFMNVVGIGGLEVPIEGYVCYVVYFYFILWMSISIFW